MQDALSSPTPATTRPPPGALGRSSRSRVAALRPRRWLYWLDLLGSSALGWSLFAASVLTAPGTALHAVATLTAIFALLRAALFLHELAHLRGRDVPGLEPAWNLLIGIPVGVPSLMYVGSHLDHHRAEAFGTRGDPEYLPMAHWGRLRVAAFVALGAFVPVLLALRWGLLAPLSLLSPRLRQLAVERLSTLAINPAYRRAAPRGRQALRWARLEAACALWVICVAAGVGLGWIPVAFAVQLWLVSAGFWLLNQARTLVAHRYHGEGQPVGGEGQLLDSIDLAASSPLTLLIAPLGLRYHALHHALPGLPYHSLGQVHRRLARELPADSAYCRAQRGSLEGTLCGLWRRASQGAAAAAAASPRASAGGSGLAKVRLVKPRPRRVHSGA